MEEYDWELILVKACQHFNLLEMEIVFLLLFAQFCQII